MTDIKRILDKNGIFFLSYGGEFTQALITAMTKVLEKKVEETELSMKVSHDIFVVFIEMGQNIMNYAKKYVDNNSFDARGLICVGEEEDHYYVSSQNSVSHTEKAIIEEKLDRISTLSKEEIKQLYKKTRREKRKQESQGAGLGFLEIAKKVSSIEYSFIPLSDDKFLFKLNAVF